MRTPIQTLATRWLLLGALACAALTGCVASRPYQTTLGPRPAADGILPPPAQEAAPACAGDTACTVFVEFDDFGNLMNRAQLQSVLKSAEATAQAQGSILLYMHGWHNDAAPGTPGVAGFTELVRRSSKVDQASRPNHPGQGRMLGIYVGWRGDSISSAWPTLPLSYGLTFWDRKAAAETIGSSGGVYDLLSRLSEIRRRHDDSKLLLHGHSFGAAALYMALSNTLMDQIRMDAVDSPCAATIAERKRRDRADASLVSCPAGMAADLVLLVNPAFEAMRLRPQLDLARSLEYKPDMPPRLVVLTTDADWATQTAFPVGRSVGTVFNVYADAQSSAENLTALGHHIPYVTHQLAKLEGAPCHAPLSDIASLAGVLDSQRPTLCVPTIAYYPKAKSLLLTRCDERGDCAQVAGQHRLARGTVQEGRVPYRLPLMNIRTTRDVSTGHGDIWNDTLENFVLHLVVLAGTAPGLVPKALPPSTQ